MSTSTDTPQRPRVEEVEEMVVRFAGDSGDGIQVTGNRLTESAAVGGNDLATLPDFPAEIRAPAGTLAGVSGFQLRFASRDIHTPGDQPDVLVVMNPAALRANIRDLRPGGTLIANTGNFGAADLRKAGLATNPLEDGSLEGYRVVTVNLKDLTLKSLEGSPLSNKAQLRCKNFFALGMVCWLFSRPLDHTTEWIQTKFKKNPDLVDANLRVLRAGYNYAETTEVFQTVYKVPPAVLPKGTYRNVMGNEAVGIGLVAASKLCGLDLFYASYPITPASDVLHQLSGLKHFGTMTFQAEDEIAAIAAAIGASFAGKLAVTGTSGPGVALKGEAIGLAVMTELPLVILNVQRGGPSTGLPTKTEQADLMQAIYGRNGECPVPVLAASSPAEVFDCTLEACRIALKYMTPVMLLTDGYIANGAEPWCLPHADELERFDVQRRTDPEGFLPYARDEKTLARPWAVPGTPGLEHRIGGLEKQDLTGNVSYDSANHEHMIKLREQKVLGIARDYKPVELEGDPSDELLVIGWGSTSGAIRGAVRKARMKGWKVSRAHVRNLWPLPQDLGDIVKRYKTVLVPEMNRGQFCRMLRSEYLVDAISYSKVMGQPFTSSEILAKIGTYFGEAQ
ncbi:MAG: 2-oxoacid:acceptor oxidoreductase subunit alpha [Planctomycetes bacterium]|nr:2-oxoacid:acceptor oxidoreductase subunit alpha [Planctomycetota bacterium]